MHTLIDLSGKDIQKEIQRLSNQYQFFHWHLAFPDVFHIPKKMKKLKMKLWVGMGVLMLFWGIRPGIKLK